jgi:hypothetical protein
MPHDPTLTLTGWKEISAHLRVTVRTAQLWEKQRGLPIHRYPGDGKPRVYAHPEELEAWLRDSLSEVDRSPAPAARRTRWPRLAWIAATIAVLGSAAWIWTPGPGNREVPVRCALSDKTLQAFDSRGEVIWQKSFPTATGLVRQNRGEEVCAVLDADLDGSPEVYLQFWGENRFEHGGALVRMTDDGKVRWRRPYGKQLQVGDRAFPATFTGRHLRPVRIDDRALLVTSANHSPYYPAEVALIDPLTGDAVDTYYHPGNIYDLVIGDLDGNGDDEVLLAAINNPGSGPGHPVLVTLDLPFSGPGGSRRVERDFFGNPGPEELAYYVFPRADVDDVTGIQSKVIEVGVPDDGPLTLSILSANGKLTYSLDVENVLQPRVLGVVPETGFRLAHDHLADEGLVDHRLGDTMPDVYHQVLVYETAPDGNAPEVAVTLGQGRPRNSPAGD